MIEEARAKAEEEKKKKGGAKKSDGPDYASQGSSLLELKERERFRWLPRNSEPQYTYCRK